MNISNVKQLIEKHPALCSDVRCEYWYEDNKQLFDELCTPSENYYYIQPLSRILQYKVEGQINHQQILQAIRDEIKQHKCLIHELLLIRIMTNGEVIIKGWFYRDDNT